MVYRRLHTPTNNPMDWYLGKQVNTKCKDYVHDEDTGMVIVQTMSEDQIKRQEKMHGINLLNK